MTRQSIMRYFVVAAVLLWTLSTIAGGKVEVTGDTSHGTVTSKADGAVVTLTVTPQAGYYIRKSDIKATRTFMPTANARSTNRAARNNIPMPDDLALVGNDPDDLSQPRTYTVTLPGEEYDILLDVKYTQKQTVTEGMVSLSETVFVYNEQVQRPVVSVQGLMENRDYMVTYSNPASKEADTYTVTVTGYSMWAGTITRSYKIFRGGKAEVNNSLNGGTIATAVDGLKVTLTVTPADGYYIRKQDVVVAKTFMPVAAPRRTTPVADLLELTGEDPDDLSLPRTYTAQLPGWEYSAYVDAVFTQRQTITSTMVTLSASSFVYNGSDQKPTVTVKGLKEGKDYLLDFAGTSWSDVGTYSLTVTGRSTWKGVVNKTYTITKAPSVVTVAPQPQSLIYSGSAQHLVAAGEAVGGTLMYSLDGTTYQAAIPTGVAAGSYTIYYKVQGDSNHTDTEAKTVTATIAKKAITISGIMAQNKVYDGTIAATLVYDHVVYSGIVEGDVLTVTADGAFTDANAGADKTVSISHLTLDGASIANYQLAAEGQQSLATATISKAASSVAKAPVALSLTYTGSPQTLAESGEGAGGLMQYSLSEVGPFTDAVPTGTAAGSYTLYYMVQGDGNHLNGAVAHIVVTIAAKVVDKPVIVVSEPTFVYDGEAKCPSVTVKDGETVIPATEYVVTYESNVNAGDAKVIITDVEGGNYIVSGEAPFTIGKKDIVISGIMAQNKVYDGTTAATLVYDQVVYSGIVEGDALTVTADGAFTDANAGADKTVSISHLTLDGASIANYQLAAEGQQSLATATISKAASSVAKAPVALSLTYTGSPQTLAESGEGAGGLMQYSLSEVGPFTDAVPTGTAAGSYTLYYMVQGDGNHLNGAVAHIVVTIAAKVVDKPVIVVSEPTFVYDGEAKCPSVTVKDGETVIPATEYVVTYESNVNAGDAKVIITDVEGGNYIVSGEAPFTIMKADAVVVTTPKALELDYNGEAQVLVSGGETIGGVLVYSLDGEAYDTALPIAIEPALYTVYYKVIGDDNHFDTEVATASAVIRPQQLLYESGGEANADIVVDDEGNVNVVINELPEGFFEGTAELPTTLVDENSTEYGVTEVSSEAFNDMPSDIIVVLPEGVSTTEGVTNVVNGDGTCETMDLTDISNFDLPIDVEADKVVYVREVKEETFTVCLPYDLPVPENTTAYFLDVTDGEGVTLQEVEGVMEAYQPYVLVVNEQSAAHAYHRTDEASAYVVDLGMTNVTFSHTAEAGSVERDNFTLCGTMHTMTHEEGLAMKAYVLQPDNSWRITASSDPEMAQKPYLAPFQAYLLYTGHGEMDEVATTFDSITTCVQPAKPDDKVSSETGWYDLSGRKLGGKPTRKGVYLHQRKVVVH